VEAKGGPKLKESAEKPKPLDPNAPLGPGEVKMDGPDGPMIIKRNPDGSPASPLGRAAAYLIEDDTTNGD